MSRVASAALALALAVSPVAFAQGSTVAVRFDEGKHAKAIMSSIKGDEDVNYTLQARAGQVMHILFATTRGSCYMNVYEPGGAGEAVHIGSSAGNEFGASPTKAGTYGIQVYQMRATARRGETCTYSIAFELTGGGTAAAGEAPRLGKPVLGAWGIETQHIAKDIKPGDDFYRYVNEGWLATARPPAGLAYANAFVDAYLRTQAQLAELVGTIKAGAFAPGSDEQMIGALYQSYVDMEKRNALGLSPIKDDVDALLTIGSREQAAMWMARPVVFSFIGVGPSTDSKSPQRYVLHAVQAGLGLPSPEFYLLPDEPYAGHRTAYRDYIAATFERAGIPDGAARAAAIMALETSMAKLHWSAAERRDWPKLYHSMSVDELKAYAPGFPWDAYLTEAGYAGQNEVVLMTDTSVQALARLFGETPIRNAAVLSRLSLHRRVRACAF